MLTKGAIQFAAKVKENGGAEAVAAMFGISKSYVYALQYGKRGLTMGLAGAIEAVWSIPMQDWNQPPEVIPSVRVVWKKRASRG
jgi:DNA-binding transcriptional regulator YdaS (Cro superfamily)